MIGANKPFGTAAAAINNAARAVATDIVEGVDTCIIPANDNDALAE